MADDNKYNLEVAPFWATKLDGTFMSISLKEEHIKRLIEVGAGGKFVFRILPEELYVKNAANNERTPRAYLEFMTPDKVKTNG